VRSTPLHVTLGEDCSGYVVSRSSGSTRLLHYCGHIRRKKIKQSTATVCRSVLFLVSSKLIDLSIESLCVCVWVMTHDARSPWIESQGHRATRSVVRLGSRLSID